MHKLRAAWKQCAYQVVKLSSQPRLYLIILLIILFAVIYATPVAEFAAKHNRPVNVVALFPLLMGDVIPQMVFMMLLVLMLSDAPFLDRNSTYILIRSDRDSWALGQILYVAMSVALYHIAVTVICWLLMIPYVEFSGEWGKVWTTLAHSKTNADVFGVPDRIVAQHTVLSAVCWSYLLSWLAGCVIGLVMFIINAMSHTRVGVVIAGIYSVWGVTIFNSMLDPRLFKVSPVSLSSLRVLDAEGTAALSGYPSLQYAVIALSCSIVALVAIIIVCAHRSARIVCWID